MFWTLVTSTWCLFAFASRSSASFNSTTIIDGLKASGVSLSTQIVLISDPTYKTFAQQRWSTYDGPTYLVSVKPALESDVVQIVQYCARYGVPFLATGGGHGFSTTLGKLQGGLEIDLGLFKNVTVDASANSMTIGGSVKFKDIIGPLTAAGKEMTTGSSGCVGMIGATLAGGVGRYNGLHGMILDSLLSVRIVTGNGEIVTASKTENSDLFWGIRGAGFTYGIIVSATYQVYDLTYPTVVNADLVFPLNKSAQVLKYFKSFETETPAKLALILLVGHNVKYGGTYILVNVAYPGPISEAKTLLQPLLAAGPTIQKIESVTWDVLISTAFLGAEPANTTCPDGFVQDVYGGGLKTYNVSALKTFLSDLNNLYVSQPGTQGSVFFIEHFPWQAVRAVPDEETAYPHRDFTAHLLYNYAFTDSSLETTVNDFATKERTTIAASSGLSGLQVYVSYAHGDEPLVDIYSQRKLDRLRALKQQWDPLGLFNFNNPF